jgi:hypothetical protein
MKYSSKTLKTSSLFVIFFLISCTNPDANKIDVQYPAALLEAFTTDPGYYALYFSSREINTDLTTNCGIASPATSATGATGAPGTTTPAATGTTSTVT